MLFDHYDDHSPHLVQQRTWSFLVSCAWYCTAQSTLETTQFLKAMADNHHTIYRRRTFLIVRQTLSKAEGPTFIRSVASAIWTITLTVSIVECSSNPKDVWNLKQLLFYCYCEAMFCCASKPVHDAGTSHLSHRIVYFNLHKSCWVRSQSLLIISVLSRILHFKKLPKKSVHVNGAPCLQLRFKDPILLKVTTISYTNIGLTACNS